MRKTWCAALAAVIVGLIGASPAQAGTLDQEQPTIFGSCPPALSVVSLAQTFTPNASGGIDQVDVGLVAPFPTTPLTVEIRTTSGGLPTSTVLGTTTIAPAPYFGQFVTATFAAPAPVSSGTQYAIVLRNPDVSFWGWCNGNAELYGPGAPASFAEPVGPWAGFGDFDFAFKTYVTPLGPSTPATLTVDDDLVQCPTAAYQTIQAAVDAAGPGDTINVCRGTYNENVTISGVGKSGIKVWSSTALVAAVVKGWFSIEDGAEDVSIERFRVEPPAGFTGISLTNGGSAALIRQNLVVGGGAGVALLDGDAGTIRDNTFLGYTFFGVKAGGTTSVDLDVMNNTMTGAGPSAVGLSYTGNPGVEYGGVVFGNTISKNLSGGIFVGDGDPLIKGNNVFQNGNGIRIGGVTSTGSVENNKVTSNTGDGISVSGGAGGWKFLSNNAKANTGTDCKDESLGGGTAGTANTWTGNYGLESSPVGICTP